MLALTTSLIASAYAGAPRAKAPRLGDGAFSSGGVTIRYHVMGKGPVCVVHPGGPGLSWSYFRLPELEKSLTVVYLEPVGSGASDRLADPAGYSLDRWAGDVNALADHLGLVHFYLLGHSHGGFVAQKYAIAHGARLRGLILVATSPRTGKEWESAVEKGLGQFEGQAWFQDAVQAMAEEANAKTDAELERITRREMPLYVANYTRDKAHIDPLVADLRCSVGPMASFFRDPFDVRGPLAGVRVPTLVVSAQRDIITAPQFGEEIHRAIAGSELVVIGDAGHMVGWDKPRELADAVAGFVEKVEARSRVGAR